MVPDPTVITCDDQFYVPMEDDQGFESSVIILCDRPQGHDGLHSAFQLDDLEEKGAIIMWSISQAHYEGQE